MEKQNFKESDLYSHLKKHFISNGYSVKSEVLNCDLVAVSQEEVVIVEMKKNFCLEVIYQALDRMKYTNSVYVAIGKFSAKNDRKKQAKIKNLLKKLDLGLIYVNMYKAEKNIDIILTPSNKQKINKNKNRLLKEFNSRTFDSNIGGVTGKEILTAYREQAIKIACALKNTGESSAKNLIQNFGCCPKTNSILSKNYYGWFIKVKHGVYSLSLKGHESLKKTAYIELTDLYKIVGGKNE